MKPVQLELNLKIGQISIPLGKVDLAATIERCDLIESPPVYILNIYFLK